ncbi:MAG: PD-(D/E)XK nuclease family protein [Bacteroidetes bacterium]|nr:PD-(D/E)XK nuclease family protein [Bacteroidota bacterium]
MACPLSPLAGVFSDKFSTLEAAFATQLINLIAPRAMREMVFSWTQESLHTTVDFDQSFCDRQILNWPSLLAQLAPYYGLSPHLVQPNERLVYYQQILEQAQGEATALGYLHTLESIDKILALRDEMLLFDPEFILAPKSSRFKAIKDLEDLVSHKNLKGLSDLYRALLQTPLPIAHKDALKIAYLEPLEYYPIYVRRLLEKLAEDFELEGPQPLKAHAAEGTDLRKLQSSLINWANEGKPKDTKTELNDDASISLLAEPSAAQELQFAKSFLLHAAGAKASLITHAHNSSFNRRLERVAGQQLPNSAPGETLGPTQLVGALFNLMTEPVDVQKVYAFLEIQVKPLSAKLSGRLKSVLQGKPSIASEEWNQTLSDYWQEVDETYLEKQQAQYKFWFESPRYGLKDQVNKDDFKKQLGFLSDWARGKMATTDNLSERLGLEVLRSHLKEFKAVLQVHSATEDGIPLEDLYAINSRMLRQRSVALGDFKKGSKGIQLGLSALAPQEYIYWAGLNGLGVLSLGGQALRESEKEIIRQAIDNKAFGEPIKLSLFAQTRIVCAAQRGLQICFTPQSGEDTKAVNVLAIYLKRFALPEPIFNELSSQEIEQKQPLAIEGASIEIPPMQALAQGYILSYSSLKHLLAHPHRFVLENYLGINKRSFAFREPNHTELGSLFHNLAERALSAQNLDHFVNNPEDYIEAHFDDWLNQEAAIYQQAKYSLGKIKQKQELKASLKLIAELMQDGWQIDSLERIFKKVFLNHLISGKADLILRRGQEFLVIDYKTGNPKYADEKQLLLYAFFAEDAPDVSGAFLFSKKASFSPSDIFSFRKSDPEKQQTLENLKGHTEMALQELCEGHLLLPTSKNRLVELQEQIPERAEVLALDNYDPFKFLT